MKNKLTNSFKIGILFLGISFLLTNCQKENEPLTEEENAIEQLQNKSHQSHLRAEDMANVVDFVNTETNNTRQVIIGKKSIKKAKQDYRSSGMSARTETSFGYIDTSNALVVESENVISYTFKVVSKDLTNFINYIVVEDKATLDKYSYFMKYTPTTNWTENKLSLSVFSGTIDYYNEDETLQTTLTLEDGYIIIHNEIEIPCSEIVFNPNDSADDSSNDGSSSNGTGGGSTGGAINNDEGTSLNWSPWESWWTGWIASGGGGGGDETSGEQEISSGGTCGPDCNAAPGVACTSPDHPYSWNQRTGQINLKSTPTVDNPCIHTGVIAFLIGQLDFTQEQVDLLMDIEYANVYEKTIDYLNFHNYSDSSVTIIREFTDYMVINGNDEFITGLFDIVIAENSTDINALKFILEAKNQDKIYNDIDSDFLFSVNQFMEIDTSDSELHDPITIHLLMKMALIKALQPDICNGLSEWQCDVKVFWEASKDVVHIVLDGIGLVPVVGEVADLINGGLYLLEGDGVNATLSFAATIPFAGWAATGSKYAIKIIEAGGNVAYTVGTKVRLTWKVLADGTIYFGSDSTCRKQLRKALGLAPYSVDPRQAHHIIPLNLQGHPAIQQAAKSENAFHLNETLNGIPLDNAVHNGSHFNYDNAIESYLDDIDLSQPLNDIYNEVADIINSVKNAVQNNPTTHINQLNF